MKKTILLFALITSSLFFSQKNPIIKEYKYSKDESKGLIKAKTDLYIMGLENSEFTLTKKEDFDHYQLGVMANFGHSIWKFNVKYDFYDKYYTATLYDTTFEDLENKKFDKVDEDNLPTMLEGAKDIAFKNFEEKIKSKPVY